MSNSSFPETEPDADNIAGNNEDGSDDNESIPDDLPPLVERDPFPRDSFDSNNDRTDDSDESDSDFEEIDAEEDTEDDDDDDEEEEDHYVDYEQMIMESEMHRIIQRMAVFEDRTWSDEEDEPVDNTNSNSNGHNHTCTCPACLMNRIPGSTDFRDDQETENGGTEVPLHREASPCAVCMEPETLTRSFADLPCCGPAKDTGSPYDTSSTRFCRKCFSRCIAMHRCAVPSKDSVVEIAGECPRCKKILVLQKSKTEAQYERDSLRVRPLYKRTKAQLPSSEALFWYIARNGNKNDVTYRPHLVILALCSNPSYIPEELFFNFSATHEDLRTLCQWGLLRKKETPQKWYQTFEKLTNILFNDLHLTPLVWLWEGLASIVEPRLESAKTAIYDWKVSQIYRSIREKIPIDAMQEATAVYCMDPLIHSELRSFVFFYIQESEADPKDDWNLMPPILEDVQVTSEQMGLLVIIKEKNCYDRCALGVGIFLGASLRAFRKLHIWKGLWLINHALSLVVLSAKNFGIPPLCDWPELDQPTTSSWRKVLQKTRWQWHLLTGCNVVLAMQIWKILRQLLTIGWDLVVGASFCLAAGKIVASFTPKKQAQKEWLPIAQYAACTIVVLHLGWNSGLHNAIKDVVYRNRKQEL